MIHRQQDRGLIAACANLQHSLLATVSWDNSLRVYTTACNGAVLMPHVAKNEHSCPFTGIVYDPSSQQV